MWIKEYTQTVKFLYEKLVEKEPPIWMEKDEERLNKLKSKLVSAPVLNLPSLRQAL